MPPVEWFNTDATNLRTFLADLIEEDYITDLEGVTKFCDRPQKFTELYDAWVANGFEFPEDDDDESDDDDEETEEE